MLPVVLPWLLLVPLTMGITTVSGTVPRMVTLGIVGALVSLAVQPVPDSDGRQAARIGASALTWALTALADSVLGPTMQRAVISLAPVAVLSGALSDAIGGLGGAWLAAGGWGAARAMGQPRLSRSMLVGVGGRWLLGCALIGMAAGLVLPPSGVMGLSLPAMLIFVVLIGAGGGLLLAWLRGEAHEPAWRRASRGLAGALAGLALAFYPAAMLGYSDPLTAALVISGGTIFGTGTLTVPEPYRVQRTAPPVAILTSRNTASAGEFSAFSLLTRPSGATRSFGEQTPGLTTSVSGFTLYDGGELGVERMITLNRATLQPWPEDGVAPDVPMTPDYTRYGALDDPMVAAARQWLLDQPACAPENVDDPCDGDRCGPRIFLPMLRSLGR